MDLVGARYINYITAMIEQDKLWKPQIVHFFWTISIVHLTNAIFYASWEIFWRTKSYYGNIPVISNGRKMFSHIGHICTECQFLDADKQRNILNQ